MGAFRKWLAKFSKKEKEITPEPIAQDSLPDQHTSFERLAYSMPVASVQEMAEQVFVLPKPAPGVVPKGGSMAMDSMMTSVYSQLSSGATFSEGLQFLGYPYLSELSQRPEYRRPAEIIAKEMTRKWITLTYAGEIDGSEKLGQIEKEMARLQVRDKFREAALQDGLFGRSQIYLDMGVDLGDVGDTELKELKRPLFRKNGKIGRGDLKALRVVEPIWTYPNSYDAVNPLKDNFFRPDSWFVMGMEIHHTRLLTFVSREVPDMLKPAYAFGGLSLSQMMKPYVDNWLRTRQSVSDLIKSYSVSGLKTNLSGMLNMGGAQELQRRMQLFNQSRDNRGVFLLDKETEEWFNITTPLTNLDQLQAQSQEHMSSICGVPLVKLLGITPSGLNASSDGEIRAFYDWVESQQETLFRKTLTDLINIIQLSLFGEVDENIGFKFDTLWSLDEEHQASVEQIKSSTAATYYQIGALAPKEIRNELARRPGSPYKGLDLSEEALPELPGAVPEQPEDGESPKEIEGEKKGEENKEAVAPLKSTPNIRKPNVSGVKIS